MTEDKTPKTKTETAGGGRPPRKTRIGTGGGGNHDSIDAMLASFNGKHGIIGCLLITGDGSIVSSTMPEGSNDSTLAALSSTLFSNNDVSLQRMNRGSSSNMTLVSDHGILFFCQVAGHYLIVHAERTNLEDLIYFIDEQIDDLKRFLR